MSVLSNINTLTTNQYYGHGTLTDNRTSAFVGGINQDGKPVGVPTGWIITVNDQGGFFNAKNLDGTNFTIGPHAYKGGTLKAQAAILIHELGHVMKDQGGAEGFNQNDHGGKKAGQAGHDNDKLVNTYYRSLIEGLR
jgi:hypothetical protein